MKILLMMAATSTILIGSLFNIFSGKDPVDVATKKNEIKTADHKINGEVAKFLVLLEDVTLMNLAIGRLAVEKATNPDIKRYGRSMVSDQIQILKKIDLLATGRNITLPSSLSGQKEDDKETLSITDGRNFENRFIRMMSVEQRRDVLLLENAVEFEDAEVRAFAEQYLPIAEERLNEIWAIREGRQ